MKPLPIDDLNFVAAQCSSLWEELRGAKILVTGGTGLFGRWILESLLFANQQFQLNLQLISMTRDQSKLARTIPQLANEPALTWLEGDLRNPVALPPGITHIIHAATDTSTKHTPTERRELFDSIVTGTRQLLDCARNSSVQKFLMTSSGGVYGKPPVNMPLITETCPTGPDPMQQGSAYAEGKRAAEFLCAVAAAENSNCATTVVRGFAFVGPLLPLEAHFAIGNFIRDAMAGTPIRIKGDGTPVRSYLYTADLVIWIMTTLLRGTSGQAYNLGSDVGYSMKQLAELTCEAIQPGLPVIVEGASSIVGVGSSYVPNIEKAKTELGLEIYTPLSEAIKKTAEYYRTSSEPRA
jgi:dTDP-glucose 4,6-dehydratase